MEKTNRELLIKDICSRLSYGVYVKFQQYDNPLFLCMKDALVVHNGGEMIDTIQYLYLRPMSSMTEEERIEYNRAIDKDTIRIQKEFETPYASMVGGNALDYLVSHHFDWRGLIEKGLAIEAPKGMYETE